MKSLKKAVGLICLISFLAATCGLTSCGGDKRNSMRVNSKPGMGNSKHKNKHVWGK